MEFIYRPYPIVRLTRLTEREIDKFLENRRKHNNVHDDKSDVEDNEYLLGYDNDIILFSTIDEEEEEEDGESETEAEQIITSPEQKCNFSASEEKGENPEGHFEDVGSNEVDDFGYIRIKKRRGRPRKILEAVKADKIVKKRQTSKRTRQTPVFIKKRGRRRKRKNKDAKNDLLATVECEICGKFLKAISMPQHQALHKRMIKENNAGNLPYKCPVCQHAFKFKQNLKKHFVLHLENNPFICKFPGCSRKFSDSIVLERHVELHTSQPVVCQKCGLRYSSAKLLRRHSCKLRSDESKLIKDSYGLKCISTAKFRVKRVFNSNIKTDGDDDTVKIEQPIELERVHLTDRIIETQNGPIHLKGESLTPVQEDYPQNSIIIDQVQLPTRGIQVGQMKDVNCKSIHVIMMNDPVFIKVAKENPDFAKLMSGSKCRLRQPKIRPKTFKCEKCNTASFSRFWSFKKHERTCFGNDKEQTCEPASALKKKTNDCPSASKPNPFLCDTCGYQSTSVEDLKHHQQSTPDHVKLTVKHKCPVCGYPFDDIKAMKAHHKNIHLSKPTFKCIECDKSFATKDLLRNHSTRVHMKHNLFICFSCGRRYKEEENFRLHECPVKTRPVCQICHQDCSTIQALRHHIYIVHTKKAIASAESSTHTTTGRGRGGR